MFWIVLMCGCQKWFLKNEKTSLACILARKVIWKAPTTTLPNTLLTLFGEAPLKIPKAKHHKDAKNLSCPQLPPSTSFLYPKAQQLQKKHNTQWISCNPSSKNTHRISQTNLSSSSGSNMTHLLHETKLHREFKQVHH